MENFENCQKKDKRTLMNAYERLNVTVNRFEELSRLSEKLVDKFNRTENVIKEDKSCIKSCDSIQFDIVDLFDNINTRLEMLDKKIYADIEKVIDMID